MNWAYAAGYTVGILVVVGYLAIIAGILYKKKYIGKNKEYDERQKQLRGKAYKVAYLTLIAYLLVNSIVKEAFDIQWATASTEVVIGIFISLEVFAIICIKNDTYFSRNDNPTAFLILLATIVFINVGVTISNLLTHKSFITNGMLNEKVINLICGILLIGIIIALIIKILRNSHDEE